MMYKRKDIGKVITGMLIGSVVGATVGWLTAPASGVEIRRRLKDAAGNSRRSIEEKVKTAEGNVESRAREFMEKVGEKVDEKKKTTARRGNVISTY